MRVKVELVMAAVATVIATGGIPAAWADVAPPDACTAPGQPCSNTNGNGAGVCTASFCSKLVSDGDGGFTSMTYSCNRCLAPVGNDAGAGGNAGAGGAQGTGGAAGTGGGSGVGGGAEGTGGATQTGGTAGPDASTVSHKDSGCSVAPPTSRRPPRSATGFPLLVSCVVIALLIGRRRVP